MLRLQEDERIPPSLDPATEALDQNSHEGLEAIAGASYRIDSRQHRDQTS